MTPDVNQFNLDEDGEEGDADFSECVNTFELEEESDEEIYDELYEEDCDE